jgi:hypothetical protein
MTMPAKAASPIFTDKIWRRQLSPQWGVSDKLGSLSDNETRANFHDKLDQLAGALLDQETSNQAEV